MTPTLAEVRSSTATTGEPTTYDVKRQLLDELDFLEAELQRRLAPDRIERSLPPKVQELLVPSRYKGLHGGRGGTKSTSFARMLVARCLRNPGTRWLCTREIQISLRDSVKRLLEDTIALFEVGDRFTIYDTRIDTPGGGVIIFQGLQNHTAESIKSLQGFHGAWVEEAQTISEKSLKLLRPTIREEVCRHCRLGSAAKDLPCAKNAAGHLYDPSELWFSWNPEKATDPIDVLLRGAMPPAGAMVFEVNWQDNPYFPDVLRAEMETDYARDPESASHVWGGKYVTRSKASVFKNWRVAAFETPLTAAFLFGGDWGFSVDPTVLVRGFVAEGQFLRELREKLGVGERVLCIDAAVYEVGCEIDDTPALFDNIDPSKMQMARRWEIVADSARPETISYMQRHGYPRIVAAKKGAGSVEEGVKFLQSYDIVVHPSCCHQCGDGRNHVQDELENYKYKVHPLTGEVMPVLEDKKNHTIDSIRYMAEKLNKAGWVTW